MINAIREIEQRNISREYLWEECWLYGDDDEDEDEDQGEGDESQVIKPHRLCSTIENLMASWSRLWTAVAAGLESSRSILKVDDVHADTLSATKALEEEKEHRKMIQKKIYKNLSEVRDNGGNALEIYELMEKLKMPLSPSQHGVRIDRIAQTKGLSAAETYFNRLDHRFKTQSTYRKLLKWYCREGKQEKAKALFKKMDGLKYLNRTAPFQDMMVLYMSLKKLEKVAEVINEMNKRNIRLTCEVYAIWWKSCHPQDRFEFAIDDFIEGSKGVDEGEEAFEQSWVISKGRYGMDHRGVMESMERWNSGGNL
ncbi:hypothetical protein HID58_024738 [Brassica napus]|uniref:Pentatricopeptide repeat-containing protein n=1 Tax=Brassica napus TaxID=3708 RepID=A0ABQ8CKJ0_BRANA|nr:hypothetical protein HID58_024738 [Brassica napus]